MVQVSKDLRVLNTLLIACLLISAVAKILSVFEMITTGSRLLILGLAPIVIYSLLLLGVATYKRGAYILTILYMALSARAYLTPAVPYGLESLEGLVNIASVASLVASFVLSAILVVYLSPEPSAEKEGLSL